MTMTLVTSTAEYEGSLDWIIGKWIELFDHYRTSYSPEYHEDIWSARLLVCRARYHPEYKTLLPSNITAGWIDEDRTGKTVGVLSYLMAHEVKKHMIVDVLDLSTIDPAMSAISVHAMKGNEICESLSYKREWFRYIGNVLDDKPPWFSHLARQLRMKI
jgi:hypothetical protein